MTPQISEQRIVKFTNLVDIGRKLVKYQSLGYKLEYIIELDNEINKVALHMIRLVMHGFGRL